MPRDAANQDGRTDRPGSSHADEPARIAEALRVSEHRLRMAISVSPMTVFNQDRELRYTWLLNPRPGPYGRDVRGKTDRDILERPEDADALESLKQHVLQTGRGLRREIEVMLDGELRRYDLTLEPLHIGDEVVGLTGAALDVTEQSHMEEALRSQAEALAETDRRKDEFIAMLGHELRSPLAPIRNALESLGVRRQLEGRPRERELDVIGRQLDHLTRLVDDLLDVARITRGRVDLRRQPVELRNVVAAALETVEPTTREREQRIEVTLPDRPMVVRGDPVRLAQVLSNLLSNASKYSDPGADLAVAAHRDGRYAVLEVRDPGIGIPPEILRHVFDHFFQVDDSLDRSDGGLGLGLTLVKALTEMHEGTVHAASEGPGRGSVFSIRLPLAEAPVEADGPGHAPAPSPRPADRAPDEASAPGVRVVVVDDSVDTAESFAELLELKGHVARAANDGPGAIELCRSFRPEVVFLDIGLPGMSGYQVAEQLRATAGDDPPLIVAVTGYGQEESRRRSSEAGFDRHLLKPIDLGEVLELLDEAARRRGRGRVDSG